MKRGRRNTNAKSEQKTPNPPGAVIFTGRYAMDRLQQLLCAPYPRLNVSMQLHPQLLANLLHSNDDRLARVVNHSLGVAAARLNNENLPIHNSRKYATIVSLRLLYEYGAITQACMPTFLYGLLKGLYLVESPLDLLFLKGL